MNLQDKINQAIQDSKDLLKRYPDCDLLFLAIVGSTAYNINTESSDVDLKGVYVQKLDSILKNEYKEQISNKSNDINLYEISRFFNLANSSNPNILELLYVDKKHILYQHPLWDLIYEKKRDSFLSKKAGKIFSYYAISQINKAAGLNKKINNPIVRKKTPIDFCYALNSINGKSQLLKSWLKKNDILQENCGLQKIDHGRDIFALYTSLDKTLGFKGICLDKSNDLRFSSIPKNLEAKTLIYYNQDGYSQYCRKYTEYQEWIKNRNPHRYQDNLNHGHGYDTKNMMHCIRLLEMSIELAKTHKLNVLRPNREELLAIRYGKYSFNDIMFYANKLKDESNEAFLNSKLSDNTNESELKELMLKIKKSYYNL